MENQKINDYDLEQFREKLARDHRDEFLNRLVNEEDPSSERYQPIEVLGKILNRLTALEQQFLTEMLADNPDEICPTCLAANTVDLANIRTISLLYNQYVREGAEVDDHS